MPGRDGTGPLGFGPMTGWGQGFCRQQGVSSPVLGYGRGRRMGRGFRGARWGFYPPQDVSFGPPQFGMGQGRMSSYNPPASQSSEAQCAVLEEQLTYFSSILDDLKKQLESLKSAE